MIVITKSKLNDNTDLEYNMSEVKYLGVAVYNNFNHVHFLY